NVAEFQAHEDAVEALAFSPDGAMFATGSKDRTVRLWQLEADSVRELLTLPSSTGPVSALAFHPNGDKLAVLVQGERVLRVWHLDRLRKRLGSMGLDWQ